MEGKGESDELYPIAVLIDELKVLLLPCASTCAPLYKPQTALTLFFFFEIAR